MTRMAVALGLLAAAVPIAAAVALGMEVQVVSVRAEERGPSDVELQPVRARLRRLVGYRSFRVVQQERRQCTWRNPEEFVIPGGRSLRIMPKGLHNEAVMMQIRLFDGRRRLVDTDVRLRNRGTMLLGVGHQAGRADGALIIMLKAEAQ